jgi:hypothetical protein
LRCNERDLPNSAHLHEFEQGIVFRPGQGRHGQRMRRAGLDLQQLVDRIAQFEPGHDAAAHVTITERVDEPIVVIDDERDADPSAPIDPYHGIFDRIAFV